jgi:alpha-1,6-mannosyltransferase
MRQLHRALCTLFVGLACSAYFVAASPAGARGLRYIGLHLALGALMVAVWALSNHAAGPAEHRWTLWSGMAARALLIAVPPFTTHDVVRYLWDGHAALSGIDPYRISPAAAALTSSWPIPVDNAHYVTLYPPGAIGLFALCARLGPAFAAWAWKILVVMASILTLRLSAAVLRAASTERHLPLVALSPLLVLEAGIGAHLDTVVAFFVVAALFFVQRGRPGASGIAVAAGALVKFLPIFALVPASVALGSGRARRFVAGALAALVAGYAGAWLIGFRPLGSLLTFFEKWRFGSPVYSALSKLVPDAQLLILLLIAGGLSLVAVTAWSAGEAVMRRALAIPLLISPVVFPWYLVPLVPFIAIRPSAFWIAWTTAAPLTYEVLDRFDAVGTWQPASWPLWIIGTSCCLGIALDGLRRAVSPQLFGADRGSAKVARSRSGLDGKHASPRGVPRFEAKDLA